MQKRLFAGIMDDPKNSISLDRRTQPLEPEQRMRAARIDARGRGPSDGHRRSAAQAVVRPTNDPKYTPPPMADAELERMLSDLERRLLTGADNYTLGSVYRRKCSLYDQHYRSIDFFKKLVADRPDDLHARIDLGCAYVDKIPTQGGLAAIVSKGRLARKALDQLDWVIERSPTYGSPITPGA